MLCVSLLNVYNKIIFTHAAETYSGQLESINIPPFTERAGPKVPVPASPIGIFPLFFTPAFLAYLVEQLALEYSWTKITVEELQAYMGIKILMGLVKLPSIYDYWKKDDTNHCSPIATRVQQARQDTTHHSKSFQEVYSPGMMPACIVWALYESSYSMYCFLYNFGRRQARDNHYPVYSKIHCGCLHVLCVPIYLHSLVPRTQPLVRKRDWRAYHQLCSVSSLVEVDRSVTNCNSAIAALPY